MNPLKLNATNMRSRILAGFASDKGVARSENQDRYLVYQPENKTQQLHWGNLFMVADGMGGRPSGAVASDFALTMIRQKYYYQLININLPPVVRLKTAIQQTNEEMIDFYMDVELDAFKGMGTTLAAAVIFDSGEAYIIHMGDSRVYLFNQGAIIQITTDHICAKERKAVALAYPNKRNLLTRSLGRNANLQMEDVVIRLKLKDGDNLLLATDGITKFLPEAEIAHIVTRNTPQSAVNKLIQAATEHNSDDNMTAVLLQMRSQN